MLNRKTKLFKFCIMVVFTVLLSVSYDNTQKREDESPVTKSEILHATVVSIHDEYITITVQNNNNIEDLYTADFSLLASTPDVDVNDKVIITYSGEATLAYPGSLCGVTEIIKDEYL